MRLSVAVAAVVSLAGMLDGIAAAETEPQSAELRVGSFSVDITPPLGAPVAYAPARSIQDPLYARGIVVLPGDRQPVVLVAVDHIGIANAGQDLWRLSIADAAGTTSQRVAVHSLHQHDAPRCDLSTELLLAEHGLAGTTMSIPYCLDVVQRVSLAVEDAIERAKPVTHIGVGKGKVERVASNRRILGDDGKVAIIRWSKSRDPEAQAAPEGLIDPYVWLVSFWADEGATPIASLTYYATHPQSYYGDGDVTSDFVGIARTARDAAVPGVTHIHFDGAGGNIAAGKYNDGSPERRPILAARLAEGMKKAWDDQEKRPIDASQVEWRCESVALPLSKFVDREKLAATIADPEAPLGERVRAARRWAWVSRLEEGKKVDLTCLKVGDAYLLQFPGELFIEYQLHAQSLRPDDHVCMAAYGEGGMFYIGTAIAYSQGGYETQPRSSLTSPDVEAVLHEALERLLLPGGQEADAN